MQSRAHALLEIFRPRRRMRQRFQASSQIGSPGNVTFRRRFTLPTGEYETTVMYLPPRRELSVNWTFNNRNMPSSALDARSNDEIEQARHDVGFIFQYLSDLISYAVHNFPVAVILFESVSNIRLYDRFARLLAQQYNGSVEKRAPTPLFGVTYYTIRLHGR